MSLINLKKFIYFDSAATTFLHPDYIKIKDILYDNYGYFNINTNSTPAKNIHSELEKAKSAFMKDLLGLDPLEFEIRITNGATEANKAIINYHCEKGLVFISNYEHPSIYKMTHKNINRIPIKDDGNYEIDYDELAKSIEKHKHKISLVSVMAANNEIPVFNNIFKINKLCKKYNIPFHSDISQAFCKSKDKFFSADFLSLTLHKVMCDKGHGVLVYRRDLIDREKLLSFMVDQTLDPIPFIAATYFLQEYIDKIEHYSTEAFFLADMLLKKHITFKVICPKDSEKVNRHIMLISFTGKCSLKLKKKLDEERILVSIGSACSTNNSKSSHVIHNSNLSHNKGILRISFASLKDVEETKKEIIKLVNTLQKILPECDYEEEKKNKEKK